MVTSKNIFLLAIYSFTYSSLIHIWLNNINPCLHIFIFTLSSRRINFMISGGNWLINYGRFINQFLQDNIKLIRWLERVNTKMCIQRMSIFSNQIYLCIYEMLSKSMPIGYSVYDSFWTLGQDPVIFIWGDQAFILMAMYDFRFKRGSPL